MIKFVNGNFFDYHADIRVNTVNCVGVMGAGAALQFKKKYPKMYDDYVKSCNSGKVKIGLPHVWYDNEFFSQGPTIINLPTKDHWKNPSEYEYVEKGLIWLKEYLSTKGNITVTLPALGCGHGGLDWSRVKKLITDYLSNLNAEILVFEPESSTNRTEPADLSKELKDHHILKLSPSDKDYPSRLKGRSATDIYIKGNASALRNKIFTIIVDSKANDRERSAVFNCLEHLDNDDFTYLLGYNSSFETDIVKALLSKKAKIVLLIPYGILELKVRNDLKRIWDENNIAIISLSQPNQSWRINESLAAFKLRIKLSDVILIANNNYEPLIKYEKDLMEANSSLFYINYWDSQIDFYKRLNARQIGRNKETQLPNLDPILTQLHQ